jgi:hypothetical protein
MYRPLPDFIDIKESKIEGDGLFTAKDLFPDNPDFQPKYIAKTSDFLSHIEITINFSTKLYRTAIGGFINHSSSPNCTLYSKKVTSTEYITVNEYYLKPSRIINAGEELTLDYTKQFCGKSYRDCEWLNQ